MERMHYIEAEDKLVIENIYDVSEVLKANEAARADAPEHGKYRHTVAGLVPVMSMPEEHVIALKNKGYDLMSPDPEVARRAYVYVQTHEPQWMTVNGKPFAEKRPKWR